MLQSLTPTEIDSARTTLLGPILETFKDSGIFKDCPPAFIIYAHDSKKSTKEAKAAVVTQFIEWFEAVGYDIRSDQTPLGPSPPANANPTAGRDILATQHSILSFKHFPGLGAKGVIIFGSEVLGEYLQNKLLKTFVEEMRKAVCRAQEEKSDVRSAVSAVYKAHKKKIDPDFHHVLTELALLDIRESSTGEGMHTFPVLLNGTKETCFPEHMVKDSTRIYVKLDASRPSQQCFLKLLGILAPQKTKDIKPMKRVFKKSIEDLENSTGPLDIDYLKKLCLSRIIRELDILRRDRAVDLAQSMHLSHIQETLTKSYERFAISTLSANKSSIESGYVNLTLIEHVTPDKPRTVEVENLFADRSPRRILVKGTPGTGKSTLCKKLAAAHRPIRVMFDWVILIPLRQVEPRGGLEDFLHQEYFLGGPDGRKLAEALRNRICFQDKKKTLLILDGWDELRPEKPDEVGKVKWVVDLARDEEFAILITTRTAIWNTKEVPVDRELESRGFSWDSVAQFLAKKEDTTSTQAEAAREIREYLLSAPTAWEIASVPFLLDALCFCWFDVKPSGDAGNVPSTTALYEGVMATLWRKDIPRLAKPDPLGMPSSPIVTADTIKEIKALPELEEFVAEEIDVLGNLAFKLTEEGRVEFGDDDIRRVTPSRPLFKLRSDMKNHLSVISSRGGDETITPRFQFLHSTIQEYFAARWLVGDLEARLPSQMRRHIYHGQFVNVWKFVAGLLKIREKEDLLLLFITTLSENHPRPLLTTAYWEFARVPYWETAGNCLSEVETEDWEPHEIPTALDKKLLVLEEQLSRELKSPSSMFGLVLTDLSYCPGRVICKALDDCTEEKVRAMVLFKMRSRRQALPRTVVNWVSAQLIAKNWDDNNTAWLLIPLLEFALPPLPETVVRDLRQRISPVLGLPDAFWPSWMTNVMEVVLSHLPSFKAELANDVEKVFPGRVRHVADGLLEAWLAERREENPLYRARISNIQQAAKTWQVPKEDQARIVRLLCSTEDLESFLRAWADAPFNVRNCVDMTERPLWFLPDR